MWKAESLGQTYIKNRDDGRVIPSDNGWDVLGFRHLGGNELKESGRELEGARWIHKAGVFRIGDYIPLWGNFVLRDVYSSANESVLD